MTASKMTGSPKRELAVFSEARKLPTRQRAAYLDEVCGADAELRKGVEELLKADEAAGNFLENPAAAPADPTGTVGLEFALSEKAGDRLGRYKLLQQIGEGGCGVVYMAEQLEPVRRQVALKVIKLGMDTKSVIARFEAERQALALMDNTNIAKVLDAGVTDKGRPYFVMELVRGIKITDYCDLNHVPTKQRLELFMQVCRAVQHAHQKGIIHRDLKPSNILITMSDGVPVPKLIDFGIAKATHGRLTDQTLFTAFEQFIGTPAYMSPEQAQMSAQDIDTRSDIYSLGVLLYELLTGQTPFDAEKLARAGLDEIRRTIREVEPVHPSTRLNTMLADKLTATAKHRHTEPPRLIHLVRGDLDWIVMKALEKNRARRYETANGLAMDIERHLENEPIVARPPSSLYRLQKMVQRNKLAFAAVSAVALSLLAGLGLSLWQAQVANRARGEADRLRLSEQVQRMNAQHERDLARSAQNEAESQRTKATASERSAQHLLYASDMSLAQQSWVDGNFSLMTKLLDDHRSQPRMADERGFEYYYLQNLAKGEQEQVLYHSTNAALRVAISPDGKWLAANTETEVRIWDLTTRTLVKSFPCPTNDDGDYTAPYWNISFSHDSHYLSIASEKGLQLREIPGGQIWQPPFLPAGIKGWAAFSPVAHLIAFNENRADVGERNATHVWDYLAGKQVRSLEGAPALGWSPDGTRLLTGQWATNVESWNINAGSCLQTNRFEKYVSAAAISPDGRVMAAADWQGTVHLTETAGGRVIGNFPSDDTRASALAFSPDGNWLATGSGSQVIQIWDVKTRLPIHELRGHKGKITNLAFTPDGRTLASTATDGGVMLWDLAFPDRELKMTNDLENYGFNPPQFSPDGRWLALQTNNDSALILDAASLQVTATLAGEFGSFSPDGRQAVTVVHDRISGNEFHQLQVWTVGASANRASISLETNSLARLAPQFSPDGTMMALAMKGENNQGRRTQLFDAATGARISFPNNAVLWHPRSRFLRDRRTLIYADRSQIKFWDLQLQTNICSLQCSAPVVCFAVSPDEKILAVGQADFLISLWDIKSGARLEPLAGNEGAVMSVAFSPDGRTLASGSEDRTVKLWHLATGRELASFSQDTAVYWVAFSPDNQMLVSGGVGFYKFWLAPRNEDAVKPFLPKFSLADLPPNSLWHVPDGLGMSAATVSH